MALDCIRGGLLQGGKLVRAQRRPSALTIDNIPGIRPNTSRSVPRANPTSKEAHDLIIARHSRDDLNPSHRDANDFWGRLRGGIEARGLHSRLGQRKATTEAI